MLFMAIMLITLSACSMFGTVIDFASGNKTVITIWMDNGNTGDWAGKLTEAFEAKNPDIVLKWAQMSSVDTRQQMTTNGPAGLGADVFIMPHDHMGAALESGLLLPIGGEYKTHLKERIFTEGLNTVTLCYDLANNQPQECKTDKSNEYIFAAPLSGESLALFYNKDILMAETGSDQPATTFEQIFEKAATYNDYANKDTDGNLDPKIWFAYDVGNPYDAYWLATVYGASLFGPSHTDPDDPGFDTPEMINALAKSHDMYKNYLNLQSTTVTGPYCKGLFEAGKLAYTIDGPWSINRYVAAGRNFGVVKLPTLNGVQPYTFSGVQVAAIYRGSSPEKQIAGLKLIDFMTSVEGMQIMYTEQGKLPALKDVSQITGLADNQYLRGINDQLAYSVPMPIIPEMGFYWSVGGTMYSNAWNGIVRDADGNIINTGDWTSQEIAEAIAESTLNGYNALRGLGGSN